MNAPVHDTLVYRLSRILFKLNQGEALEPRALAREFGVNLRTIQRDLNVRLADLRLQKTGACYAIDPAFLGNFKLPDIERFASHAGVGGLFPDLGNHFSSDVDGMQSVLALEVRGHAYEDLRGLETQFRQVQAAIVAQCCIRFSYQKPDAPEKYVEEARPYKLVNQKGIWYLIALVQSRLKTYAFTRMSGLWQSDSHFDLEPAVLEKIARSDSIWLGEQMTQVQITVSAAVACYFERRKLIPQQVIEQTRPDGSLVVGASVSHPNQILPIVRYWIPHVRIVQPVQWQQSLDDSLRRYLACS
jgi:predicted DNA-binding transcriptional regulator YafY